MNQNRVDKLIKHIAHHSDSFDEQLFYDSVTLAKEIYEGYARLNDQSLFEHTLDVLEELTYTPADPTTYILSLYSDIRAIPEHIQSKHIISLQDDIVELLSQYTELANLKLNVSQKEFSNVMAQMFFTIANSPRVTLVRIADRVVNLKTADVFEEKTRQYIADKALHLYVPLSEIIGLGHINQELQDLAFKLKKPDHYNRTKVFIEKEHSKREKILNKTTQHIETILVDKDIQPKTTARIKGTYSSYKKLQSCIDNPNNMSSQLLDKYGIADFLGVRILVDSITHCYQALSTIGEHYELHDIIKDYIANPKENGYQSIHFFVKLSESDLLEIQLRTHEMHAKNEYGDASHFFYKLHDSKKIASNAQTWIASIVKWQEDIQGKSINQIDYFQKHIFVLTPKHDVIKLPKDATVIDFAYQIHDELGNNAIRAFVNGKNVPLEETLHNGDNVEITTGRRKNPPTKCLPFVKTARARKKLSRGQRTQVNW